MIKTFKELDSSVSNAVTDFMFVVEQVNFSVGQVNFAVLYFLGQVSF
jgi:hypothetical protein